MEHITVETAFLRKMVEMLERREESQATFEFLVGSCFPDIMNNIKDEMRRQYTLGYIQGKKETENINTKLN